jgi:hypothetical protein
MSNNRYSYPFAGLVIFLFGATVGSIVAFLLGTNDEGEMKPVVKAKIKDSKKKIKAGRKWVQETARDLAESVPENLKAAYEAAKKAVATKVDAAKKALEKIDREKYAKFVSEVVEDMKKAGTVAGTQAGTLKDYLMADYALVTTPTATAKKEQKRKPRKTGK